MSFGIEIDQRVVVAKTRINSMINPTPNDEIKRTRLRTAGRHLILAEPDNVALYEVIPNKPSTR